MTNKASGAKDDRKVIVFLPLNSPGHINSCLGLANRLNQEHNFRTVFLLLGYSLGAEIQQLGHELVQLDEVSVYEDYEFSENDLDRDDEGFEESMAKKRKQKRQFPGVLKWPQIVRRYRNIMRLGPLEACCLSMDIMEKIMVGELTANHENYKRAIESIKPDLIIIDAYFVPPFIVKQKSCPWVRLHSANPLGITLPTSQKSPRPPPSIGFSILGDKNERQRVRLNEPDRWKDMCKQWECAISKLIEAAQKATGLLTKFLEQEGCEPLAPGQQAHNSPYLNLYVYPEELDYDKDDDLFQYPKRWFRCDSLMRSRSVKPDSDKQCKPLDQKWLEPIKSAKEAGKHVVFFSLGTIASGDVSLMRKYVDMFRNYQNCLFLISKGANGHKFELHQENQLGDNYLPQTQLLEFADLAIVHGGNNTLTECLYYGKPMIVLPVFADQLDNAQRMEDLKLGRRLNVYNCTEQEMGEAIEQIMGDKNLVEKVKSIGDRMRARDDSRKVCLMLKKLILEGNLSDQFIEECKHKIEAEIDF